MKNEKQEKQLRRPFTVMLSPELKEKMLSEQARIEREEGYRIPLTAVAARAMERGFNHE
ncbi:MAG: hypothetical protein E6868_22400 [Pantoea sp.]|jgi:hypothetical protein|uniref:hypothetical protein n=1 Tax=Pantoea sp. TaxID=69393 RepID=UPI0028AFC8D5|nr:hypothetical protein [Pantoea sp.]MDU1575974.1 hypothetical protein [Pantoea sp.]HBW9634956.1 hypothetical protein [Klebsiella pneumoniae]